MGDFINIASAEDFLKGDFEGLSHSQLPSDAGQLVEKLAPFLNNDKALEVINDLPQRVHIPDSRVISWALKTVDVIDGSVGEFIWHCRRLHGIGGSEIGSLVHKIREGSDAFFNNPVDICGSKLMKKAPSAQTNDTRRGHRAEPFIQAETYKFLKENYSEVRRDDEAILAMVGYKHSKYPWMVGNPDDVFIIDGKRVLLDYKSPGHDKLPEVRKSSIAPFDYRCQLHHYRALLEDAGFDVDLMSVVNLDTRSFDRIHRHVDYDDELMSDIYRAGDQYWFNHVKEGTIPSYAKNDSVNLQEHMPREAIEVVDQLAAVNALIQELQVKQAEIKDKLFEQIKGLNITEGLKGKLGLVGVAAGISYKEDDLIAKAVSLGIDVDSFRKDPKKIDDKKLLAYCKFNKIDPAVFMEPGALNHDKLLHQIEVVGGAPSADGFVTMRTRLPSSSETSVLAAVYAEQRQKSAEFIEEVIPSLGSGLSDKLEQRVAERKLNAN